MESIDRLRKWSCHVEVQQLADEIEAEITERYMELPKGGDGEVLRIGDEVWFHDDEPCADPHVVRGYSMLNGQDVDVFVNYADEGWCPNAVTMPDVLVHAKPDPLKELLNDYLQERERIVRKLESNMVTLGEAKSEEDACDETFAERIRELMEADK